MIFAAAALKTRNSAWRCCGMALPISRVVRRGWRASPTQWRNLLSICGLNLTQARRTNASVERVAARWAWIHLELRSTSLDSWRKLGVVTKPRPKSCSAPTMIWSRARSLSREGLSDEDVSTMRRDEADRRIRQEQVSPGWASACLKGMQQRCSTEVGQRKPGQSARAGREVDEE